MKAEDKELLLKDLCARVPYHPKGLMINACTDDKCEEWLNYSTFATFTFTIFTSGTNYCRLYLRPMSSMTEEEVIEFNNIPSTKNYQIVNGDLPWDVANYKQINWLNAHHFDYRGLIEKGLALEASEGMYNLKVR